MSTRHTPGPWKWISEYSLFNHQGSEVLTSRIAMSGDPDAALLASAPDLLEACKRVLREQDDLSVGALEDLRAAVAKAEGRL